MAAITAAQITTRRDAVMRTATRATVLVARPDATDDATADVFRVKDPDPGDTGNTVAAEAGNAKGGTGHPWKSFSYVNLGTAYAL